MRKEYELWLYFDLERKKVLSFYCDIKEEKKVFKIINDFYKNCYANYKIIEVSNA
jgi:hypothetical protein